MRTILTTALAGFAFVLVSTTAFAQPMAPGKVFPGGINNVEFLYVGGPNAWDIAGKDDTQQVTFFRVPASSKDNVSIFVFDPGSDGIEERKFEGGMKPVKTSFAVYGGKGAYSAPTSQSPRGPQKSPAGTLLVRKEYTDGGRDKWVRLGDFAPSKGERVGDYIYFKLVATAVSGATVNFYRTSVTPITAEAFAYNVSHRLAVEKNDVMSYEVEVPPSTSKIQEHNYDLDSTNDCFLVTRYKRIPLRGSVIGNWEFTNIQLPPRRSPDRVRYDIVKGIQRRANGAFYFLGSEGKALKIFFDASRPDQVPGDLDDGKQK